MPLCARCVLALVWLATSPVGSTDRGHRWPSDSSSDHDAELTTLKQDGVGTVRLVVLKTATSAERHATEKQWLTALRGSGAALEAVAFLDDVWATVLEHGGSSAPFSSTAAAAAAATRLPPDWALQLAQHLASLRLANCRHNNLQPSALLLGPGPRLRLANFDWAS
jgi:hypothetical protein